MAEPPRFTLQEEPHGTGGFAKVIKGRDNILERDIAVKVLDPLATEFSESDQERFRREARTLAKLSHPNIPAIYDVDFSPGKFSLIIQFIDGVNLKSPIDKEGRCQLSEARVWFHQIASALEHAHSLGIIHRDIKPANIIIRPDRESAYLVDFGIALSTEEAKKLTKSGFVIGTAGYMSPEQQAGEPLDARTDVYSLAITLYESLAGRPIPVGEYEELSAGNEAIPPQVDELIRDCLLAKERRVDSARDFSARLAGALRATRPLSEILAHGRLHELGAALEDISSSDFIKLPAGQRELILAKISDIVTSRDPSLDYAAEQLLNLMLSKGILLSRDDYREIVTPAIEWAFARRFGDNSLGSLRLRRSLEQAAHEARGEAHEILRAEIVRFFADIDLENKENWYLQSVRNVVQTLLANPSCVTGATELVVTLKKVNQIQRARSQSFPQAFWATPSES
jgi:serine/threonine protein kinase